MSERQDISMASQEMIDGYRDGRDPNTPEPSDNRSHSYRHGFANGRDDLRGKSRAPASILRTLADEAQIKDRQYVNLQEKGSPE